MTMKATKRIIILVLSMLFVITPQLNAEEQFNPYLLNMVDIRTSSDEANQEAWNMVSRLNHVDGRILYETNNHGARFILADTPITDQPEFEYLKGIVPKGHTNSWDTIPGAGGYESIARVGYSNPGQGHSAINLELHEYGHVVDSFTVGVKVSETEEFQAIHQAEVDSLFGDDSQREYYGIVDEYFGEAFAMYYLNEESRNKLQNRAPRTFEFFDSFAERIISVGEVTGNTATMHWDLSEGVSEYEVFRNGESVGTTTDSSYRFEGLDTDTTYDFKVVAKDASGESIYTSYTRSALTGSVEDPPEVDITELESTIEEVETAYQDKEMGQTLTLALQNAKTYIDDVNNHAYTSGGNEISQSGVDSLNNTLNETYEAELAAEAEVKAEQERKEQEEKEQAEKEAEKQAALEKEEQEKREQEAAQEELKSTITKVLVTLIAIVVVILGVIFYRKKKQ